MLRKLVIVYETGRGNFATVQKEVLAPARQLQGWLVGKFVWQPVGFMENARRLMRFLHDGDLVIVAGGDALVGMATNAILLSERDVAMGIIGYGLTNDAQKIVRTKRPVLYGDEFVGGVEEIVRKYEEGKLLEIFPLKVCVNDRLWRYALNHASAGMLVAGAASLDQNEKGRKSAFRARIHMLGWWLKHRRDAWLPEATWQKNVAIANDVWEDEAAFGEDVAHEEEDGESSLPAAKEAGNEGVELLPIAKVALEAIEVPRVESEVIAEATEESHVVQDEEVTENEGGDEEVAVRTCDEALLRSRYEAVREYEVTDYEIMILGELGGDELRSSRGLAGVLVRLGDVRRKIFQRKLMRMADCAVENTEVAVEAGKLLSAHTTDIIAVNGLTMGGKWRGGRFYKRPDKFLLKFARLGSVPGRMGFALVSRLLRMPGEKVESVQVEFLEAGKIFMQTDNAWEEVAEVRKIEISKANRSVKLVKF